MNEQNDQEALISERQYTNHPILVFIILKSFPILLYYSMYVLKVNPLVCFILILFIFIFEFFITRKIIGVEMVGLSWYFGDGKFQYYSRPNPYIPKASESNIFWISFPILIISWVLIIVFKYYDIIAIPLFAILSQLINLYFYISSYLTSRKQNQLAVMAYLQDEPVNFPFVKEETNQEEISTENIQSDKETPTEQS